VTLPSHEILEATANGVERGIDGGVDVFVFVMLVRVAHDDFAAGKREIDRNSMVASVQMMFVRRFHDDMTARDLRRERFELERMLAHVLLDGIRMRQVSKRDAKRRFHVSASTS